MTRFFVFVVLVLATSIAQAADPQTLQVAPASAPPPAPHGPSSASARGGHGGWRSFRAGSDLLHSVPTVAFIEGAWSIALHINSELVSRTWDAPYPWGLLGHYSTRILYGTSWTVMLGIESALVMLVSKGRFDWLAEASYRSDWVIPVDLPACPRVGAHGGCGMGIGGFAFIQVRPLFSRWWYEAGGGSFEQRVRNDELRTVAESSWVLTPISAVREFRTNPGDDVAFRAFAGPGIYFGMHAAHMHPTPRGADVYRDRPWTEIYPLEAGIGPGARVEGRMIVKQRLSFEGEIVVAPFLVGRPSKDVPRDVAPLDVEREGIAVWRKIGLGIGWDDPKNMPFKATLALFAAELSERPLDRIGYRGGMIRFDIPLRLPKEDR